MEKGHYYRLSRTQGADAYRKNRDRGMSLVNNFITGGCNKDELNEITDQSKDAHEADLLNRRNDTGIRMRKGGFVDFLKPD